MSRLTTLALAVGVLAVSIAAATAADKALLP